MIKAPCRQKVGGFLHPQWGLLQFKTLKTSC
ncbi:hypothetical protein J572_4054, partial [Acinetobacter baumannii 1499986]